ncbi:MAG: PolC-type DNA polymerase III [Alkalispirochaetaceae bacterium]
MDNSQSVAELTFTAFDFETTGLNPAHDRIIELGAVQFRNGEVTGEFQALVDPEIPLQQGAMEITGITPDMLAGRPKVSEVLPKFLTFLGETVLVAHNAGFDIAFLRSAMQGSDLEPVRNPLVDTQILAQKAYPRQKSYSLQYLIEFLGIPPNNAHRALDDALMCMRLFTSCVDQMAFMGEITLGEILT